jgi:DNA (cytosine-5)-methyltransferase 1
VTPPDKEGRSYSETRSFRAALPGLRFKSGMRFDLSNEIVGGAVCWKVRFFFGSSKDIREVDLDGSIGQELHRAPLVGAVLADLRGALLKVESDLWSTNPDTLQAVWTLRAQGLSPFELTDILGGLAEDLHSALDRMATGPVREYVSAYVVAVADQSENEGKLPGQSKLEKYALRIISGFVIADWFNTLAWHTMRRVAA